MRTILSRAKDHKSVGMDEIPNEVLKVAELQHHVLHILNEMLRGGRVQGTKTDQHSATPQEG